MFIVDKVGILRSITLSIALMTILTVLWGLVGSLHIVAAVVVIFIWYLVNEFMFVSSLPFVSIVVPIHASSMMSVFQITFGIGTFISLLIAGVVWDWSGILSMTLIPAAAFFVCTLLWMFVWRRQVQREGKRQPSSSSKPSSHVGGTGTASGEKSIGSGEGTDLVKTPASKGE